MSSSINLKALGLNTQPNQLSNPDGSLNLASNIIIKRDNVIESRRGFKLYGNNFGSENDRAKQLLSYKGTLLRHYGSTLQFDDGAGDFSSFAGTYSEVDTGLRIKGEESNGNFYFTTSTGIKKISAKTTSQFSTASGYITKAGGIKALDVQATLDITQGDSSGFLPADSAVAYRIVWGIKDANDNLVTGTPSQRAEVYNPVLTLNNIDLNTLLEALDNAADATTALSNTNYLTSFGSLYNTSGSTQRINILALAAALDTDLVLNSGNATVNGEVFTGGLTARVRVAATVASTISVGDKLTLSGFTSVGLTQLNSKNFTVSAIAISGGGPNYDITLALIDIASPLTVQASTADVGGVINSYNYKYITITGSPDYPTSLQDTTIDSPATANELGTISDTIERIESRLKTELSGVIKTANLTTFILPLSVTTSVNVNLEFTVPDDVTSNDFYQVYRSATVTATGATVLSDLVPSDELQLVFEGFPTSAELSQQYISITDVTPDQFRGSNLYTNASTGEGILQANDVPPAAKDINKFKNYTFYANTRTRHRYSINLLGVQKLIDSYNIGVTPVLTIADNANSTSFKFVTGLQEITDITCVADTAGSLAGKYFTLNSSGDVTQYYFWYRVSGTGSDPAIAGKVGVVIDIATGSTANTVEAATRNAINVKNIDFNAADHTPPTLRVTNVGEGPATNATAGNSGFTVAVSQQGRGEDVSTNQVLLSQQTSVALAVDATARSLVKVINRSTSDVYAYYLSGSQDVPGKILLESRNLQPTSNPFYVLSNNSSLGTSFNPTSTPELQVNAGASIVQNGANLEFAVTGHGLLTGDKVIISGTIDATPSLTVDGIWTITKIDANHFSIVATAANATVLANMVGIEYLPDAEVANNEVKPNRVYFSKLQQPEAVPLVNTIDLGAEDKAILRIFPLRDSLFVFKEDGLFRISGETSPFNSALFDGSCILIASDSLGLLNNVIYGWTRKGIETITESGIQSPTISRPIDVDILPLSSQAYTNFKTATWGLGYESDNSYIVCTVVNTDDVYAQIAYRYSNLTNTWTTYDKSNTCGIVGAVDDKLYLGAGDTDYIEQERKNFDRTDYSDRELTKQLASSAIVNNGYGIYFTDVQDFEVGDVITQSQIITSYEFNTLLEKLDIDPGVSDSNYYELLQAGAGANLRDKLVALATKLDADSGVVFTNYRTLITAGTGPYNTAISSVDVANPATLNTAAAHGLYSLTAPFEGRYITIVGTDSNAATTGTWEATRVDADTFSIASNVISVTDGTGTFVRLESDFRDIKTCFDLIINNLNNDTGVFFNNYKRNDTTTLQEVVISNVDPINKIVTVNLALEFVVGPLTLYKSIPNVVVYSQQTMGDTLGFKQIREATVMFEDKAFTSATISFSTDLLPEFVDVDFNADSNGIFGHGIFFGSGYFGGGSNSAPFRTYVPATCQRCRFITVKFTHSIAREKYAIFGITLTGEVGLSTRAYR